MKLSFVLACCAAGSLWLSGCTDGAPADDSDRITVACYYFPNYHTHDARNDENKGDGWSEWELVRRARPVFEGHAQPKVPAWGYTDEKDPSVMARKIDAAADNGIDVFIFDWYYYDDGPFLNRALDEGFLGAPNTERLRFALMWANHDWLDIHPYTRGDSQTVMYSGRVAPETFERIGDHIVRDYFSRSNYWKVDGKPYFSVYDVQKFVENFGSVEAARAAMDRLREKAVAAGLGGVHWNLVTWGNPCCRANRPLKIRQNCSPVSVSIRALLTCGSIIRRCPICKPTISRRGTTISLSGIKRKPNTASPIIRM